jgi:hypothetical protein
VRVWLTDRAVVTVSATGPFSNLSSLITPLEGASSSDLLRTILEAVAASYGDVANGLNDAFCGEPSRGPSAWHHKERRLAVFLHLMERHLELLRHKQAGGGQRRRVDEALSGLMAITRYAAGKIRAASMCPVCWRGSARR